ncbi:MAG: hypothetical protein J5I92_15355 [Thiogranum sp.]|nr:hypothetical protein [Thiogranum sp.]
MTDTEIIEALRESLLESRTPTRQIAARFHLPPGDVTRLLTGTLRTLTADQRWAAEAWLAGLHPAAGILSGISGDPSISDEESRQSSIEDDE